jgi:hypothetical protein
MSSVLFSKIKSAYFFYVGKISTKGQCYSYKEYKGKRAREKNPLESQLT